MNPLAPSAGTTPTTRTYTSLRAAWIPLTALCLAFFVEMVDNTLLSIALPTIGRDLGSSTTSLQWVTGAYALTFGGLMLTAGSIADRFGRRRVLLWGLAAFGTISLAAAFVETTGELIALRAALGLCAAAMAPITNSLVFRLFDDEKMVRKAFPLMMIVGMSGFVLGPLIGGSALEHVRWEWLLVVNAPIALVAWIGVRVGVAKDHPDDLTVDALDLPGAVTSMAAIGLACYGLTSGVERGWLSAVTLGCFLLAAASAVLFVRRERSAVFPMLDLKVFSNGTVRGATIAQLGVAIAMAAVMFALILHYQYAYGWSPVKAGLANLPMIVGMLLLSPLTEALVARVGHRYACLVGAGLMAASLAWLAFAVEHGYLAIAAGVLVMTAGIRTVFMTCAVALIGGMPANRTSLGAALNDTAQEVGTSIGTALVGTLIAALVTSVLPLGTWSPELVASYFHGERVAFGILAVVVGVVVAYGSLQLTDSHETEEHPA